MLSKIYNVIVKTIRFLFAINFYEKGVSMPKEDLTDYLWIIKILNEITVTKNQFMNLVENNSPKQVDKILKGKIVDIERDKLIESLLK